MSIVQYVDVADRPAGKGVFNRVLVCTSMEETHFFEFFSFFSLNFFFFFFFECLTMNKQPQINPWRRQWFCRCFGYFFVISLLGRRRWSRRIGGSLRRVYWLLYSYGSTVSQRSRPPFRLNHFRPYQRAVPYQCTCDAYAWSQLAVERAMQEKSLQDSVVASLREELRKLNAELDGARNQTPQKPVRPRFLCMSLRIGTLFAEEICVHRPSRAHSIALWFGWRLSCKLFTKSEAPICMCIRDICSSEPWIVVKEQVEPWTFTHSPRNSTQATFFFFFESNNYTISLIRVRCHLTWLPVHQVLWFERDCFILQSMRLCIRREGFRRRSSCTAWNRCVKKSKLLFINIYLALMRFQKICLAPVYILHEPNWYLVPQSHTHAQNLLNLPITPEIFLAKGVYEPVCFAVLCSDQTRSKKIIKIKLIYIYMYVYIRFHASAVGIKSLLSICTLAPPGHLVWYGIGSGPNPCRMETLAWDAVTYIDVSMAIMHRACVDSWVLVFRTIRWKRMVE